jgi:hypothetical protein
MGALPGTELKMTCQRDTSPDCRFAQDHLALGGCAVVQYPEPPCRVAESPEEWVVEVTEVVKEFLEHYQNRGTVFMRRSGVDPEPVLLRYPSGADIPLSLVRFRERVRGFLEDSASATGPEQVTAVTRTAFEHLTRIGE